MSFLSALWTTLWPTYEDEVASERLTLPDTVKSVPEPEPPVPDPPPAPPPTLDVKTARMLLKQIEAVGGPDAYAVDPRCQHCKGIHDRACPRVREMTFSPAGQIIGVTFWKEWDENSVLWPEDVMAIVMAADELDLKQE